MLEQQSKLQRTSRRQSLLLAENRSSEIHLKQTMITQILLIIVRFMII